MNFKKFKRMLSIVLSASMILSTNMTGLAAEMTAPAQAESVAEQGIHEHNWQLDEVLEEATAEEAGIGIYACSECGATQTGTIEKLPSDTEETKPDEAADEELSGGPYEDNFALEADNAAETGTARTTCANHNIGSMVLRTAPTCFTEGTAAHYHCAACNNYYRTKADAEAQTNPVTLADLKIQKLNHNAVVEKAVEPTCTTDGHAEYYTCAICERIYETMEDLYNDVEDKNSPDSTCLTESEIATDITKAKLGHSYKTTGAGGAETRTVVFNGWDVFDPTNYKEGTACGITAARACSREGCTYSQTATEVSVQKGDTTSFDCTAAEAELTYTATATFEEETGNEAEANTPPTETDPHNVPIDGHKYTYQFVWPSDPNNVLVNANGKLNVSPDNKVTLTRACNVCDAPAADTDTAEATLSSNGITIGEYSLKCYAEEKEFTATATLDGHTETDVKTLTLPVGDHDLVFHERKEPTCTEAGNYEYYECSNCGKTFWDEEGTQIGEEEQTDIPALGHNIGLPVYSYDGVIPKATFSCIRSAGEGGCDLVIEKTDDVTVDLASVRKTNPSDGKSCGETTSLTYDITVKFDRNAVKFNAETNQWYEDTLDTDYAPITYNGTVTREGVLPHKFTTVNVEWVSAVDTTTESGKNIYDPEQGIKATLTCETCSKTVKMASEGVTPDTGDIALNAGSVLALGEIDTEHAKYVAANCSTGGHDVYPVTITGTTADTAATPIAITDRVIETDTAKSGHKYIIKELTEDTNSTTGDPIVASMTIGCALGDDCPDTKSGNPVNITYTPDNANGVTVTYPSVNGTPEAGGVKEVSCTEDGVKVWAVDAEIGGKKVYKEYAANGTGTRWTLQKDAPATGHNFGGTPEWDWSDYGTETDGGFLPFEGEGNKVHAAYTCQNGNCGGAQHTDTEPAETDTVYSTTGGKRVKTISVVPTNNKDQITDCESGGTVTYTATAGGNTDTKSQSVGGHVWNALQWDDWAYVLDGSGEKTYKDVTVGKAPDAVIVKVPVKTIMASRTCSICGETEKYAETEDTTTDPAHPILGGIAVTDQDTEPASCTRAGSTLYFAALTMDDGTVIKNTMPDIEVYKATGHNYDIEWKWYGRTEADGAEVEVTEANESQIIAYTAASAKKVCQNGCGKEFAATADKFPAACINGDNGVSCDKTDVFKYEAAATFTDDPSEEYYAQKMIVHEETGHDYEWTITNWTTPEAGVVPGNYDGLTLHGVCSNNPERHIVDLENVTVTVAEDGITQSPETCSEKASLVVSGTFTAQKDSVDYAGTAVYRKPAESGDPTGPHKYTTAVPVWNTLTEKSRDASGVTYEMDAVVKCDHAPTLADHNKTGVKITAVAPLTDVEKIDCSKDYSITYTMSIKGQAEDPELAGVTIADATTQDGITAVVNHTAGSHTLERILGQEGSCTKPGWKTHYHCNVCGRNYSSYTAETEVPVEQTEPLGHLYGDPTFEWLEGRTARAIFTCTRSGCTTSIAGHTKAVMAEVDTDPNHVYREGEIGCVDSGKHATDYYMVSVTEDGTQYDGDLAVAVPAVDHDFSGTDGACIYCGRKGLVKVSFVYNNGTEDVSISDIWVAREAADISFPSVPNRPGYTFDKWSLDGENEATAADILTQVAAGSAVIVRALYNVIEATGTVTVQYLNGSELLDYAKPDNGDVYTGVIGKNVPVSVDSAITVGGTAYTFSHWAKDIGGTTLGTSPNYDVYIASEVPVTVYAVYQQGTEVPEAVPVVAMTDTYRYTEADGTNKLAFTTAMSIPEGYTMVESGILYGVDEATFGGKETEELNAAMVLNGTGVFKKALNGTKTNLLSVKITAANESREVYARGYLMCENAATGIVEVYYTDSVHQNYTNASELTTARTVK